MDLPKAASCSTLVALPIGHSPQAKSATIGSVDSSCRLLHVHIGRDGNVVLTGFSRVDGGGAPQATHFDTPFAVERGVLPKDAVPLLAALDMQSRLTTHALKLFSGRKPPPASRTSFGQSTTDRRALVRRVARRQKHRHSLRRAAGVVMRSLHAPVAAASRTSSFSAALQFSAVIQPVDR